MIVPADSVAEIQSLVCECGWEVAYAYPEEVELLMGSLLRHLREHGTRQPQLTVESY